MKYNRILLKLSGEALIGSQVYGIDSISLNKFTNEIKALVDNQVEIAIVIGGGNIFRGLEGTDKGFDRVQGDYMGMLATIINSIALQTNLEKAGVPCIHMSGLPVEPVCEPMNCKKAVKCLEEGKVVIISGGTGNPFFTTDSAAALRALEIKADAILKGTRVDGVYNADPEKDPDAIRYNHITFDEAYEKGLKIMDMTAFTLCKENNLPIVVFNIKRDGNLLKIVNGENIGTAVTSI
jgi:uridylate kinase